MSPPRPTDRGFALRYGIVAGSCAVLHNIIVIGSVMAGTSVLGAAAISFCLMVMIGYLLLSLVAFRTALTVTGFTRYVAAMAINFPLATGLLWLFSVAFDLPVAIVSPSVTILMYAINFLATRWAIGRGRASCAS